MELRSFASSLKQMVCYRSAVLRNVEVTHGRFFNDDFIPALSKLVATMDELQAVVVEQARLKATDLDLAVARYCRADAQAAACIATTH